MAFVPEIEQELKEWGLTAEEMAQLEPILGKAERQEKFKGGFLRQSDFTKKTQALAAERRELEDAVKERERLVTEDATNLGTWKQQADSEMAANVKALEDAKVKLFRVTERIKAKGENPKDWELDSDGQPPKVTPQPEILDGRYLTKEEAQRLQRDMASQPFVATTIHDLDVQHRELFGKPLNATNLLNETLKWNKANPQAQRDLNAQWEAMNEVPKKREELNEASINARIEARVSEERTKILSENKLPVHRGGEQGGSPILAMRESLVLQGTDRNKPTNEAGATEAAVAAYNTGKYKGAAPVP